MCVGGILPLPLLIDNVFDHNVETETIFKKLADPVVRDAVRGINGMYYF